MTDDGDCGAIGGMKIGRGNRSTRRKPVPAPLCPPQIPYDQTRARTPAAAVGNQRLSELWRGPPTKMVHFFTKHDTKSRLLVNSYGQVEHSLTEIRFTKLGFHSATEMFKSSKRYMLLHADRHLETEYN
jgi:hypothetical protein